jgi:hypothetical protein
MRLDGGIRSGEGGGARGGYKLIFLLKALGAKYCKAHVGARE